MYFLSNEAVLGHRILLSMYRSLLSYFLSVSEHSCQVSTDANAEEMVTVAFVAFAKHPPNNLIKYNVFIMIVKEALSQASNNSLFFEGLTSLRLLTLSY